jgi:VPDSG-CTERM motif
MKSLTLKLIMGAAALVLAALPASATAIISDNMSVFASDGTLIAFAASVEPEGANDLRTLGSSLNLGDMSMKGDYYLVFEPNGTTLSDIVGLTSQAIFAYVSDPVTLANFVGTGNVFDGHQLGSFTESATGGTFDISNLLALTGPAAGGSAQFFSDGNVPDGGSAVALLGIALVGVEALRRKFKAC